MGGARNRGGAWVGGAGNESGPGSWGRKGEVGLGFLTGLWDGPPVCLTSSVFCLPSSSLPSPSCHPSFCVRHAVKRDGHRETPKTNQTWSPSYASALRVPPVLPLPCPLLWSCSFSEVRLYYQQRSCGSCRSGLQCFLAELLPVCGNGLPSPFSSFGP